MAVKETVESAISAESVVIFSKSYCPYCAKSKALFAQKSTKAKILELDLMGEEGAEIQAYLEKVTSQSTVPSIWINGKFIGGNSDVQTLEKSGKLDALLR